MPLMTTVQLVSPESLAELEIWMVRTLRLVFGEQEVMGMATPLLEQVILQRLVATYIPQRLRMRTEDTSKSWKGVKTIVQQVLVTPRELSLQVRERFFSTPVQKMFWFWLMNSSQPSMEPLLSIRLTEQQGRSRLQGSLMLLKQMLKLDAQTAVVLKGMQVRYELPEIFKHRGVCSTLAKVGLAEAKLMEERTVLLSKNCQLDMTMSAVEQPLPLKEAEGATVKLMLDMQDPASPAMLSCMADCLGFEQTRMFWGERQVGLPLVGAGPAWRQVMAPLVMSMNPTMISKRMALVVRNCVGMTMLNLVEVSVPGSCMLMRSQLSGQSVVRLRLLDPWMQVKVAAILLVQGYELQEVRVVNRLVHPWQAKMEMILRWLDWMIFCQSAVDALTNLTTLRKLLPVLQMLLLTYIWKLVS